MTAATVRRAIRALCAIALLCIPPLLGQGAQAQPSLTFKRIINNWPTIQLYFSAACAGQPSYFTDKKYFKVVENGLEISQFELWCPDPAARCAISVSLVFDASGSMAGAGNTGAKAAGHAFVDLMDSTADEAAVLWFSTTVTLGQSMTQSPPLLHAAIDALPASGGTALWDGIYLGLLELINNSVNQCRAVVVLTDGQDNSSTGSASESIALANLHGIRVFTIELGGIGSAQLQALANLTGGRYYETPNPTQLVAVYQEIASVLFQAFQECVITYTASCMDGTTRAVDLSLVNFCGGSDVKTKSYKALRDTSTFTPLRIGLGSATADGGSAVTLPLLLLDTIPAGSIFHPSTFSVLFDTSLAHYTSVATPPGSLLAGVPVTATPIAGGVILTITDKKTFNAQQPPATLLQLTLTAANPSGFDTVRCPLDLSSWSFSAGCFRPLLEDGAISIVPRHPEPWCSMYAPPYLSWVRSKKDYEPNPFIVRMTVRNTGNAEARNARFRILFNSADVSLLSPAADTVYGTPSYVAPSDSSFAQWAVTAKRRLVGDSLTICIEASFDNHERVDCCARIWVPPAEAVLECLASAPTIRVDPVTRKYTPMPFSVDVVTTNTGGRKTDTVFATITVPDDLVLTGPDAPDRHTKRIIPSILNPGQQGGTNWTLWHPATQAQHIHTVRVCVKTANADSTCCEVSVAIPSTEAPVLSPRCSAPDSLHFDRGAGGYAPNPFQATLSCVNRGGQPASGVTGFLYLPAGVELADPLDSLRKTFNPSTMDEYKGGAIPSLTWSLRYTKKHRYDSYLDFRFVAGGAAPGGIPLDSQETWCRVRVPGVQPAYACSLELPDSLAENAAGSGVEPNPFTATYRVWNTGDNTGVIDLANLSFPPADDLQLDPSTPTPVALHRTLAPGDTATVRWILTASNRVTRRYVAISATAFDDEGNPVLCTDALPIAGLRTALTCNAAASDTVIAYDPVAKQYSPSTWSITGTLTNITDAPLTNLTARIALADSSLVQYLAFDPDPSRDNTNPKTLPALSARASHAFTWHFTVAAPNATGASVRPSFIISYASDQTPNPPGGCGAEVEIRPVTTVAMRCQAASSDTLIAYDPVSRSYSPTQWSVTAMLENTGTAPLTGITAEIALLDSSLARYVKLDPDPAHDNTNPKTFPLLAPAAWTTATWYFTLADSNMTGASLFPVYTFRYRSNELPVPATGCAAQMEIQPAIAVGVAEPDAAALQLELFPDPSNGTITLRVPARPGETVRIAVVDMLGRELQRRDDVAATDWYQSALRLAPATPGTYFLHVRCGDRRWVRSVRIF